ncbi:MAG: hypothetical protein ACK5GV_11870 [Bacteroidota bacterium]|jgi:hypothetical protein
MATIVYRSLNVKEYNYRYDQDIIWVSTEEEHSKMYTDGVGKTFKFKVVGTLHPLDLQFVHIDVDVKLSDITDRFKTALLELFEKKKLSRNKTLQLFDEVNELNIISGMKEVWRWMQHKEITAIARKAGFNAIMQREGTKKGVGNVITYGILDARLLKMIDE